MGMPDTRGTLTPGARQVLEVLVLILVISYGAIEGYRLAVPPAQAAQPGEVVDLRGEMRSLAAKIDTLNRRLSWLEGHSNVQPAAEKEP